MEERFKGIGASPGIGIGKVVLLERKEPRFVYEFLLKESEVKKEVERFKKAVEGVKKEFKQLIKNLKKTPFKEVKQIIETYISILSDPLLFKTTIHCIKEEKVNAEWALAKSLEGIEKIFGEIEDDYLKQRVQDVHYVVNRILTKLQSRQEISRQVPAQSVIVAYDLSPPEMTRFLSGEVVGFVSETGGRTSHTAIVAQALKLPAVLGAKEISQKVKVGELIIVDGLSGEVIVNPLSDTLKKYQEKQKKYKEYCQEIEHFAFLPAQTLDGYTLKVMANVELFEEIPSILNAGAEGIGLFRTEFFYLQQKELPDEETLYEYYTKVVKAMAPYPVTFRTLDLGGDKLSSALEFTPALNPALGLRAIRFCLKQKDIFRTQLRALLRASAHGQIRILLPLISGLEEIKETKEFLEKLKAELKVSGYPVASHIPLGIMVEVPSAVTLIEFLAKEVDFLSIGTNDLIQYTLAIDRGNEQVAYLYEPLHPAVLRMIYTIVETARKLRLPVSVCGEVAGDPIYTPILVGMGINEISLNAQNIALIKKTIRSISFQEVRELVKELINMGSVKEIKQCYLNIVQNWFKETLEDILTERISLVYEGKT
ncbi:MAG TPA: phosphoenolpyruvate--protein phosphotransferase [Candidatus Desulfofervidus auxilii]|uniref:Phosphoenolpyruvate-protein phosphotransferase n=1 Tax=Desulfofervidus auxilii TaxID=1621989 RepID=A0A7C0YA12_DESA2|nr:phosphoenolpyruvate--protein phosphotransferase [Candidatus Desulfofervidus auxilii]